MPGEQPQPPTLGVSSRRSACDRCRGQKLRCLREDAVPDGRCDRCAKADAQCITSPIYHMRNIFAQDQDDLSAAALASRNSKRRRQDHQAVQAHAPALPQSSHTRPAVPSSTSALLGSASTSASASTSTPTTFDGWFVDPFTRPTSTTNGASSTSIPTSFSPPNNWNWLIDSVAAPSSLSDSPIISTTANPWDASAGDLALEHLFSADGVEHDKPCSSFDRTTGDHEGNAPLALQPRSCTQAQGIPSLPYGEDAPEPFSPENLDSLSLGVPNNGTSNDTPSHMEELSTINLNLVKQLKRMELPHVTLKTLIESHAGPSATTPLEEILNITRCYQDVLSLIVAPPRSSHSLTSNAPKPSESYSGYASTSTSTSISPDDSSQASYSSPPSTQPIGISAPKSQPDGATQLLVLICYVHVLKLHVALFAHIQHYLQAISETDERTLNPLPRLSGFSNIPLRTSSLPLLRRLFHSY